jgi:hypothetical protein
VTSGTATTLEALMHLNHEIPRQRHADLLREATQERLARTARLERQPRKRLAAEQLTWLLHFPRRRTAVAEPAAKG